MSVSTYTITPKLFVSIAEQALPIQVRSVVDHEVIQVMQVMVDTFLASCTESIVGISPKYGAGYLLTALAFSTASQVLVVRLSTGSSQGVRSRRKQGRLVICNSILKATHLKKFALRMDRLVSALHTGDLAISQGFDMLSESTASRDSFEALVSVLSGDGKETINKVEVRKMFKLLESKIPTEADVALQAWSVCHSANSRPMDPRCPINTHEIPVQNLNFIAKVIRDSHRLDALKPVCVQNEIEDSYSIKKSQVRVQSKRFTTRVTGIKGDQLVCIKTENSGVTTTSYGRPRMVKGRSAHISLLNKFDGGMVLSFCTIGREAPTRAEEERTDIMLKVLQGTSSIMKARLMSLLFFSNVKQPVPKKNLIRMHPNVPPPIIRSQRPLNSSQLRAVKAILSADASKDVMLIHGPPGTGKTTVIASAVESMMSSNHNTSGIWLSAQSNVAVKNIAEKLASNGFRDFKILVSEGFHFDWHEHLYDKIAPNVITSDVFPKDAVAACQLLDGARVILCTLSMFSNPQLEVFVRIVPVEAIIFDEASQIEVSCYIPVLSTFQTTLRKLVFIGDHKQLPPYGQEQLEDLRSVFEFPHLRKDAIFLDTQYRMPVPIGHFISTNVYDGKLKSKHPITAMSCCKFVDVSRGRESKAKNGTSWINEEEAKVVIIIAKMLQQKGHNWRVITPYDKQRSFLEGLLKSEALPWEDKCFNVDSFQGNESDYIIVSLVRTGKIGFLREKRRANVMLTRCKKRMIICTNRAFVTGIAIDTLLGLMAKKFGDGIWTSPQQVLQG